MTLHIANIADITQTVPHKTEDDPLCQLYTEHHRFYPNSLVSEQHHSQWLHQANNIYKLYLNPSLGPLSNKST